MPARYHDLWRLYLGQTLQVSIGRQTFYGVLIGLRPAFPTNSPVPEEVQPWAIDTPHGIELVDPDNPAVSIFDSAGPITSCAPRQALPSRRLQIGELLATYERVVAAAAKADQFARAVRRTNKT
jgi:hypothetical protein